MTTHFSHKNLLLPVRSTDWTLGTHGKTLLALQVLPFVVSMLLYLFGPSALPSANAAVPEEAQSQSIPRLVANMTTGLNVALALHLSNLTQPDRVISFLTLPFNSAFDPSLAYLAIGALPLATLLYHLGRGKGQPRLGGRWAVPKGREVDSHLVLGAAIFGIGWGLEGICPGPGLVNLGRALATGSGIAQYAAWVGSAALGGLLV